MLQKKSEFSSSPFFIVIAGPNGAGKSTTSKEILRPYEIEAFDWDKEFQSVWRKFDFDPLLAEGIRESINSKFESYLSHSFSQDKSVAYETNFHSEYNIQLAKKAKKLGYATILYFLALTDPTIAIQRVQERVRKGGHAVSESTIRERFTRGLQIFDDKAISAFDRIALYNSSNSFELQFVIEDQMPIFIKDIDNDLITLLPNLKALLGYR
ncbi:zeta toxin family protein [Imperialibacter roseus]|uniref:Zeta toxin family protein n=1 Tax=Imperialibacter roseus TaxID=1324217 RepID=A0ABZ0IIG2_9BACT|nr:zeta toxin family protein [Imperialibacter roseus]WOK04834.1 zeta toxin family protein [Imperialibacter roseus]